MENTHLEIITQIILNAIHTQHPNTRVEVCYYVDDPLFNTAIKVILVDSKQMHEIRVLVHNILEEVLRTKDIDCTICINDKIEIFYDFDLDTNKDSDNCLPENSFIENTVKEYCRWHQNSLIQLRWGHDTCTFTGKQFLNGCGPKNILKATALRFYKLNKNNELFLTGIDIQYTLIKNIEIPHQVICSLLILSETITWRGSYLVQEDIKETYSFSPSQWQSHHAKEAIIDGILKKGILADIKKHGKDMIPADQDALDALRPMHLHLLTYPHYKIKTKKGG